MTGCETGYKLSIVNHEVLGILEFTSCRLYSTLFILEQFEMLYLKVKYRREYFLPNGFCIRNKSY